MKKPKVVVTFLEAGFGHIVSSQAISDALKRFYGNEIDVVDLHIAKQNEVLQKYEEGLVKEVKKTNRNASYSSLQFLAMDVFGRQNTLRLAHNTVFAEATKELSKVLAKLRPDMVVNTHFSPNYISIELRNEHFKKMLVATYNPDPNVHGWWDNRTDIFFVNNNHAKKQAIEKSKFTPSCVRQVNFTARESIVQSNLSKQEYREKHNLPKDNFTVILADGAYATSKLKDYTNEFCKIKKPITLIVIAGKNEKVYEYFEKKKDKLPANINLKLCKFVTDIQELYGASDIFVTKAGPNAIQDSIFMKTPIMVNFYASPIEKFTQKLFCKEYKCGETILDKVKARKRIEYFMEHPESLEEYRKNCDKLDKTKNGAYEIAHTIYSALKYYRPEYFVTESTNKKSKK